MPKKKGNAAEVTTIHPKAETEPSESTRQPIEQTAAKHTYDNYKRWDNLPDEAEVDAEPEGISVSTNRVNDATSVVTTTAGDATVEYYSKNLNADNVSKAKKVFEQTNKAKENSKKSSKQTQTEMKEKDSLKTEVIPADTPWFSENSSLLANLSTSATTATSIDNSDSKTSNDTKTLPTRSYSSSGCDAMPEEDNPSDSTANSSSSEMPPSDSNSISPPTSTSSSSSSSASSTLYAPSQGKVPRAPLNEPSSTEIVSNLMEQLKRAQAEILRRDLIISRIRRELHDADLTEIVSSAQDAAAKFLDEGSCENRGRDEEEQETLTVDAIALVTEKLFLCKEIDIDQKAYVNLAILPPKGKEHFRVIDVMDSFKDRPDIEVEELSKWIRKWTNAPPEAFDPYCSCRAWCKRMGKTIEATYGYTSKPVDLNKFSTTYSAATNFLEMCNPKSFSDASTD